MGIEDKIHELDEVVVSSSNASRYVPITIREKIVYYWSIYGNWIKIIGGIALFIMVIRLFSGKGSNSYKK